MSTGPLGAQLVGENATFAVFSSVAEQVELCIFDEQGAETRQQLDVDEGYVWRGTVAGLSAGARYGFRVHGPNDLGGGPRCDPNKLLLDPYARAIAGLVTWNAAVNSGQPGDSAPYVPRSVLYDSSFDWAGDRSPGVSLADSVIYELHVKGYTLLHPKIPAKLRGTYRGLAHPEILDHLRSLGVTTVELLPVHQFVHDEYLQARGLRNYWGYQSIGYFAPHNEYGTSGDRGQQVDDFKAMVRDLHASGLEVILDVVFNHTAEGGAGGPQLCFRGLDNAAYYRLDGGGNYVDDTGCGNTFDAHQPQALRLIMDSLRYWVTEMHVDGFRFDLAAALGRGANAFDPAGAFLETIGQDPTLSQVKLIAEPWDVGAGGYDLGSFPPGWSEWNGRYRDTVRDFWRAEESTVADFATRLSGSADLFGRGRRPSSSINLVTVHDGFALADLVSYDTKHNGANGEDNRDGTDDNRSWNCGVEGATDDAEVTALRRRQRRNLLATLLLSEGVPLLLGGDELGNGQGGNNNAYCQDNPTGWIDWSTAGGPDDLSGFVAALLHLRAHSDALLRNHFLTPGEIEWLRPDGAPMSDTDWATTFAHALAVASRDDSFLLAINAWWEPLTFVLPERFTAARLTVVVDTASNSSGEPDARGPLAQVELAARSLMLLQPTR